MRRAGCSYGRVLNIPGFLICQVSAYVNVIQGSEYAWIWLNNAWINYSMTGFWLCLVSFTEFWYASGSKYARARNIARLWICEGYTGWWIYLNKPEYALIMPQYAWICLDNAEFVCIYLNKQSSKYTRI